MIEVNYFASISYGFLKQRPQQLFEAWLGLGKPDLHCRYIEPPWINLKVIEGTKNLRLVGLDWDDPRQMQTVAALLQALPAAIPGYRVAVASVVWEPYLAKPAYDLICYDLFDAVSREAYGFEAIEHMHRNMLAKSDLIFATTEALSLEARRLRDDADTVIVSNGVDAAFFQARAAGGPPDDFTKTRPVAGFIGAICYWVDLGLIHTAALALPEVDFILVGPLSVRNRELAGRMPSNVHFLGEKTYALIPAYLSLFDVALLPFTPCAVADAADPIKLYEYFALGKPVVATPLASLAAYDDGRLLRTAAAPAAFTAAIKFFLDQDRPEWREERRRVAEQNSWRSKAETMLKAISGKLSALAPPPIPSPAPPPTAPSRSSS